ncbi:MAG TPA: hypothetical protein VMB72_09570 [Acidimicrobiales bacterium]|nr:hypothetical protein [Acidimicrobiales bacterium]
MIDLTTVARPARHHADLAPRHARHRHPGRWWALGIVAFAALTALFTAASLHAVAGNSDGATVVLEGQAMSGGNALLHHWTLSLDSFWSVDALFYTVAVAVVGVHPILLYVVPAVIAALVVLAACALARAGNRGRPATVAVLTVVALLGLPSYVLAVYFLQGPLHVGTTLWCLLAFLGLARNRFGWGWALAVVLLAAGVLGDFQTAVLGMAPALGAGLVAMVRERRWRAGAPAVAAPVAAAVLALAVRGLTLLLGTYSVGRANPTAGVGRMVHNLRLEVTWGAHLLGVGGGSFGDEGVPTALGLVHLVGVAAVVAGVVAAVVSLVRGMLAGPAAAAEAGAAPGRGGVRVEDLLVIAVAVDLVLFVFLTYSDDENFSRYLTAGVVFGSILAGRGAARLVRRLGPGAPRRLLAVAGVVVVAAFAAEVGIQVTGPQPGRPYQALGTFLQARHLDRGVGDYWSASIVSVQTSDTVTVRPVIADGAGRLHRYARQSADPWYGRRFQFLVYDTAQPWGGVDAISARASFGPPLHTYVVGTYRVLVWRHTLSVPARPSLT